jgi:hypothetical protein
MRYWFQIDTLIPYTTVYNSSGVGSSTACSSYQDSLLKLSHSWWHSVARGDTFKRVTTHSRQDKTPALCIVYEPKHSEYTRFRVLVAGSTPTQTRGLPSSWGLNFVPFDRPAVKLRLRPLPGTRPLSTHIFSLITPPPPVENGLKIARKPEIYSM